MRAWFLDIELSTCNNLKSFLEHAYMTLDNKTFKHGSEQCYALHYLIHILIC